MSDELPNTASAGILRVVLDRPLRTALDYLPPAGRTAAEVPAGARVRVPVGRGQAIGLVVEHAARSDLEPARLRAVLDVLDVIPVIDTELLALLRWTAEYYHHPPGEVLFGALPTALRKGAHSHALEQELVLSDAGRAAAHDDAAALRRAPRQRELWRSLLATGGTASATTLDATLPGWRPAAQALGERGWLTVRQRSVQPATPEDTPVTSATTPALTAAQSAVIAAIDAGAQRFAPILLQGVTGSGKTEVYLHKLGYKTARYISKAP